MVNSKSVLHITSNSKCCGLTVRNLREILFYIHCKGFPGINSNTKHDFSEVRSLITFHYEWPILRWVVVENSVATYGCVK